MARFCHDCKQLVVPTDDGSCPKCGASLAEKEAASPIVRPEVPESPASEGAPSAGDEPAAATPPPIPAIEPRTSGLAIASLICGILGILITGIPAIITGHLARGQIRRAGPALTGSGMALAGLVLGYVALVLGLLALASPLLFGHLRNSRMASALDDVRRVKTALDDFARDFDGQYPNDDTSYQVSIDADWGYHSNDYFRQLHLAGYVSSERIFWQKHSSVTGRKPDDVIGPGNKPNHAEILKPGDVHWAYVKNQEWRRNPRRPLILDSYRRGSREFDRNLWGRKVIVVHLDSSAEAMPMERGGSRVLDRSGNDILSEEADAWKDSGESPWHLLAQPRPK